MRRALGHLGESDIRLLRVFVAIVEAGGLARAQGTLNLSISTISGYLTHLETRLGANLCQRGRRGFSITDDGKAVYGAAKSLLAAHEAFRSAIGSIHGDLVGELRIGVVDNIVFDANLAIPEAIGRFQRRYSRLVLSLFTLPPNHLEAALLDGGVQVAIGQYFHRLPGIRYEDLHSDPLGLYCGRAHPFFGRSPDHLTLEEIEAAPFANRAYVDSSRLVGTGPKFHASSIGYSVEAILLLILSGCFISYLPTNYARHWVDKGLLLPLLPGKLTVDAKISIAVRGSPKPPPAVKAFIAELKASRRWQMKAGASD
jgi:LysR family transcriptional regulator, transcriptional activator for bauABCD operon